MQWRRVLLLGAILGQCIVVGVMIFNTITFNRIFAAKKEFDEANMRLAYYCGYLDGRTESKPVALSSESDPCIGIHLRFSIHQKSAGL